MPIGGERIGSAYIRIFGDGSGLPDDIRDALRDVEPAVRAAGERDGDAYAEEFDEKMTRRARQREFGGGLREELMKAIARGDTADAYFGSEDWKRFRGVLRARFGEAGDNAGRSLQERFASSISGLGAAVGNIDDEVRRAVAQIQAEELRAERERDTRRDAEFRAEVQRLADLADLQDRAYAEDRRRTRAQDAFYDDYEDQQFNREVQRLADLARLQDDAYAEDRRRSLQALREQSMDLDREFAFRFEQQRRANEEEGELISARQQAYQEYTRRVVEDTRNLNAALNRLSTSSRRVGESRRSLLEDLEAVRRSLRTVPAGEERERLSAEVETLRKRLREATPEADRFSRQMRGVADTLGRFSGRGSRNNFINFLGASVRGMTNLVTLAPRVAFQVGQKMANAFVDAGGGLAGFGQSMIQLASSAAFGAAGLVAFGLVAAGLVFILGPIAALISGISAALVGLGSTVVLGAIAGLVGAIGVGGILTAGIGAATLAITGMSDEMKRRLRPELEATKKAFKDLGEDAGDAIGPGLEAALGRLPSIMARVKPAIVDISDAVGDVANSLSRDLDSTGFENFANKIGPFVSNQIRDLGEAVSDFGRGFGGFFLAARPLIRETVDNIQDLAERFGDFTNSAAGQRSIREFLADAATSAGSLADFVGAAAKAIGELATAGNESGNTIFDDLTGKLQEFTAYLRDNPAAVSDFFENGVDIARDLGDAFMFLVNIIGDLDTAESRQDLQDFFDAMRDLGGFIREDFIPAMQALGDIFSVMISGIGGSIEVAGVLFDTFGASVGIAQDALSWFATGEGAGAAKVNIDFLRDALQGAGDAAGTTSDFASDLISSLEGVSGAASDATRELLAVEAAESGAIASGRVFGLTQNDIVNATLGRAGAVAKVRKAVADASGTDQQAAANLLKFIGVNNDAIKSERARIRAAQFSKQVFESLRGSVSKPIIAKVRSEGIEPTKKGLAETVRKYDELNTRKNIKKLIALTGVDVSVKDVRDMMRRLDELDRKKPKPKLGVDPAILNRGLSDAKTRLDGIERINAIPSVGVDTSNLTSGINGARSMLLGIDGDRATTFIDVVRTTYVRGEQPAADGATVGQNFRGLALGGTGTIQGTRYPYMDRDLYRLAPGEEVISNRSGQADKYRALLKAINANKNIDEVLGRGSGKTIDASGWTIVSTGMDPETVAKQTLAELTARTF